MEKLIGLFIGVNKIKLVKTAKRKTYKGNEVSEVEYENGEKKEYPTKILGALATEESNEDLTKMRDDRIEPIVLDIIEILAESELEIEHFQSCYSQIKLSIDVSLDSAAEKLWGKRLHELKLIDVDKVLKNDR